MNGLPKISIVTPNFNQANHLEETIRSVLDQNYPNLEYIVIDGGSTDGSVEIIERYQNKLFYWISEPDNGMYHALQKGFDLSSGDIMGWINSDDKLHPNALFAIAEILQLAGVNWFTGAATTFDEAGRTVDVMPASKWSKFRFYKGDKRFIQQESTYWSRKLWIRSGSRLATQYRLAADFELWSRFFLFDDLYSCNCLVGGFKFRTKNQLSLDNWDEYMTEVQMILARNKLDEADTALLKRIRGLERIRRGLIWSKFFHHATVIKRIDNLILSLHKFPGSIAFDRKTQTFYVDHG